MKKRALCILSNMNAGGAETFLMKMYQAFDKKKYQLDFCLSINKKGFYDDQIEKMGGRIFHITPKTKSIPAFRRELREVISQNKYKYVIRITANDFGLLDLKIAKQSGAKICVARSNNSNDSNSIISKLSHLLGRKLFMRYVDKKIAPSDLAAIYTFGKKAYMNGEVTILRNALDLDYYKFNSDGRNSIRKEYNIPEDAFVVGHIGRFMKQKNHSKLISIFEEILKRNKNAYLLLVGNGELEEKIKDIVQSLRLNNYVKFTGVRRDIPNILSSMDVLIMPSYYEGMPNVVIEAQATGLPCILSDAITSEVKITEMIEFCCLSDSSAKWANNVLKYKNRKREDTKKELIAAGYDIKKEVKNFVNILFNE